MAEIRRQKYFRARELSRALGKLRPMFVNLRPALFMSGTNAVQCLIALAGSVAVARVMGPSGRGEVSTILLWSQLATWLSSLGMGRSQVYFLGAWRDQAAKRDALFPNLLTQSAVSGISMGALAWSIGRLVEPAMRTSVWLWLLIPLQLLSDLTGNYLLGTKLYSTYNAKKLMESTLYSGAIVALVCGRRLAVGSALSASAMATAVSSLGIAWRLHSRSQVRFGAPQWRIFREALRFGMKAHAADLPRTALSYVPQVVVTPLLGTRSFGIYSVALSLAGLVSLASTALAATCFADCSGLAGKRKKSRIQENLLFAVCGCGSAGVALAIFSSPLIHTVYGSAFEGSIPLAKILILWAVVAGVGTVVQHALYSCGEPLKAAAGSLGGLAVTAAALLLLIGPLGTYGVAGAAVAGALAELAFLSVAAYRTLRGASFAREVFA